MFRGMT